MICNQAASFNRCLFKVQQGMQTQLKAIWTERKEKSASKVALATDELQYLMDFNASITQAVAKTMEHLTDSVFVSIGNLTLARRDSHLSHVETGIKPDILAHYNSLPCGTECFIRRPLDSSQRLRKITVAVGRVRGLVCTLAVSFGNSTFFSRWPPYWKVFYTISQQFAVFPTHTYCWMFLF